MVVVPCRSDPASMSLPGHTADAAEKRRNPFLRPFIEGPSTVFIKETRHHTLHDGGALMRLMRCIPLEAEVEFVPVLPKVSTEYTLSELVQKWFLWRLGADGPLMVPLHKTGLERTEDLPVWLSEKTLKAAQELASKVKSGRGKEMHCEEMDSAWRFLLALEGEQDRPHPESLEEYPDRGSMMFVGRPEFLAPIEKLKPILDGIGYPGRFQWHVPHAAGPRGPGVYTLHCRRTGTRFHSPRQQNYTVDYGFIFLGRLALHSPRHVLIISGGTALGTAAGARIVTDMDLLANIPELQSPDLELPIEIAYRVDVGDDSRLVAELSPRNIQLLDWSFGMPKPEAVENLILSGNSPWKERLSLKASESQRKAAGNLGCEYGKDWVHKAHDGENPAFMVGEKAKEGDRGSIGEVVNTVRETVALCLEHAKSCGERHIPVDDDPDPPKDTIKFMNRVYKHLAHKRIEPKRQPGIDSGKVLGQAEQERNSIPPVPDSRGRPSLLLLGESGTGKEMVARLFHDAWRHGLREAMNLDKRTRSRLGLDPDFVQYSFVKGATQSKYGGLCRFFPLHVRALHEGVAGAQLEGVFPGRSIAGWYIGAAVESGHGTLFFDELGDASEDSQSRLLRLTQERETRPLQFSETIPLACCIISATEKNLRQLIAEGRFRAALYERLAGRVVEIPPLRDRPQEIPLLMLYDLVRKTKGSFSSLSISEAALTILLALPFSGNVRELENIVNELKARHPRPEKVDSAFMVSWHDLDRIGLVPSRLSRFVKEHSNECRIDEDENSVYHFTLADDEKQLFITFASRAERQ